MCCLLLIELNKQSMYILFNYFSSFSSYGNYLWADNDCYCLFVPPNHLLIILHKQLVACVIANWLLASILWGSAFGCLRPSTCFFSMTGWSTLSQTHLFNKCIASFCNILSRPAIWRYAMVLGTDILNTISVMKKINPDKYNHPKADIPFSGLAFV